MAVPRGWCLHGYRCGAEKKGTGGRWRQEGDDERGWEREESTYVPTYRRGWCIAYYLCVVFVAALRAFFCSHRLLFISTNVQLYWSAIYHPHPAPPTPPMDFFPLFENVSGLCRGDGSLLRLARRDGTTADATLCCAGMSRNFILPSWMPRLNLPPGSFVFCTLRRYCTVKIWRYLFFCGTRRFPACEREYRIHCVALRASSPAVTDRLQLWFMDISS